MTSLWGRRVTLAGSAVREATPVALQALPTVTTTVTPVTIQTPAAVEQAARVTGATLPTLTAMPRATLAVLGRAIAGVAVAAVLEEDS